MHYTYYYTGAQLTNKNEWVVTASSENSNWYEAEYAVDGNLASGNTMFWTPAPGSLNNWFQADLGEEHIIFSIHIHSRYGGLSTRTNNIQIR